MATLTTLERTVNAYIKCALLTSIDDNGTAYDVSFAVDDLEECSLLSITNNCVKFIVDNLSLLSKANLTPEDVGHNLWMSRNNHVTGFWDMDLGVIGDELTRKAVSIGESRVYTAHDSLYIEA